jgi:hypothetical protein
MLRLWTRGWSADRTVLTVPIAAILPESTIRPTFGNGFAIHTALFWVHNKKSAQVSLTESAIALSSSTVCWMLF